MGKRFLVIISLTVLVVTVIFCYFLYISPIIPPSKEDHNIEHRARNIAPTSPPGNIIPVPQDGNTTQIGAQPKRQDKSISQDKVVSSKNHILELTKSSEEFSKYLHSLKTQDLLDLAREFLDPADKGILQYGIGRELLRRLRTDKDVKIIIQLVSNTEEVAELRRFGFELLHGSFKYVGEPKQQQILKAAVQVAFNELDASTDLRHSSLICANNAIASLFATNHIPAIEVDLYCERLVELMMDRSEDGQLRGLAIDGVGRFNYIKSKPYLLKILESAEERQSAPIGRSVCLALARLGGHEAISAMGELLETTEDSRIYGTAALSIGQLGGEKALRFLVDNANRFDKGSCQVAIEKQKSTILQILSSVESPYLRDAIRATEFLYHKDDIKAAKKKLIDLLPRLKDSEQIAYALAQLYKVGTKDDCVFIVTLVPRKPEYGEAWDKIYRRSVAISVKGQNSTVPTQD